MRGSHTAPYPAPRPARRRALRVAAAAALVCAALLVTGCTNSSSDLVAPLESVDSGGGALSTVSPERFESESESGVSGTTTEVQSSNRDVITTGSISITVTDPIMAAQNAVNLTEQAGGRVDNRNETPGTEFQPARATLILRIPSDALQRTLAELKTLGVVNFVSLSASDVTSQSQDLDARITSLQTSVDRLLGLLSEATNTADLIAIETALAARQADLESLKSQRTALSDQLDYSTLSLDLYSVGVIAPASPDNFFTGFLAGWNALVAAFGGLLVGLGVALPWLISIVVVAGIVVLIVRLSRKRHQAN